MLEPEIFSSVATTSSVSVMRLALMRCWMNLVVFVVKACVHGLAWFLMSCLVIWLWVVSRGGFLVSDRLGFMVVFGTLAKGHLHVIMGTGGGEKSSIQCESSLGYVIEDVRPRGGSEKFRSAAYSNCARKPS